MDFDRELIEQSIAKQYHVLPSEQSNLKYSDWALMVSGLTDDTPLGTVVHIRAERDDKTRAKFTPAQKAIYDDWQTLLRNRAKSDPKARANATKKIEEIQRLISSMFGGGG